MIARIVESNKKEQNWRWKKWCYKFKNVDMKGRGDLFNKFQLENNSSSIAAFLLLAHTQKITRHIFPLNSSLSLSRCSPL